YAFDGNSGTIWHSNWQGASDKLKPQGTFDEIGGVIDLGQKYTINQFKFTPRSGTNSGQVTKADLYVKANEDDEWIKVAEDAEFADDATTKTFYFDEQEVQYVWFVAKESDDGWVAVSEFDIANAPAQTYTVYVEAQEGGTAGGGKTGVAENTEITVTAEAEKGYAFAGWYDAVTGTKVSDDAEYTFAVTENTALTAQFTKDEEPEVTYHTVTINGETVQVEHGQTLAQPADPVKEGYKFIGWYVGDAEYDFSQPVTSDLTITAKFEKIETPGEGDSGQDKPGTDKPGADTQKPGSGNADKGDNTAVQTGDQSSPVIWAVVLIVAVAAAAAVVVVRKKRK
ncbi:MAG TPA: InlB B-repeat-containing protein, partial [Candidatus Mediterraneibacter caccavium]|nr:InlB B-repeat-containing protein [Candidatus Mediterraneibacter caccavium]